MATRKAYNFYSLSTTYLRKTSLTDRSSRCWTHHGMCHHSCKCQCYRDL